MLAVLRGHGGGTAGRAAAAAERLVDRGVDLCRRRPVRRLEPACEECLCANRAAHADHDPGECVRVLSYVMTSKVLLIHRARIGFLPDLTPRGFPGTSMSQVRAIVTGHDVIDL